jgi:microcystin-dependent protein
LKGFRSGSVYSGPDKGVDNNEITLVGNRGTNMSNPYIGEIRMFAGTFAPVNWAFCNGQLVAIDQNPTLFNLIGTTYGGDGQSTFALPNLLGRFPIHPGGGLVQGALGGAETVNLTVAQLHAHSHAAAGSTSGTTGNPSGNFWAGTTTLGQYVEGTAANESMAPPTIGFAGSSQPHDNMIPFLAINFIISLFGIFPSQN